MQLSIPLTEEQRAALAPAFAEIDRLYGSLGLRPGAIVAQVHREHAVVWVIEHERAQAVSDALRGVQ